MTDLPLFSHAQAERLRDEGLARAESRNPSLAETVRQYLFNLAADGRAVDIDDARDFCDANGLTAPGSGFWGSIFRPRDWECVGYAPSRRLQNHAHANRRWRLRRKAA